MYTSESYPNFFRVVPSESAFNPARLAFVRHFNWTRVGTIYQNSRRYSLPHSKLLTELDTAGVEIANTQSISDETGVDLLKLKEKDVRIIIGSFGSRWAQRIFCQAYRLGIYGRRYQWILGSFEERWWLASQPYNCSREEMRNATDGMILIDVLPLSSSNEITVSGMTAAEYEAVYNRARKQEYSKYHGYAYDGVWTIAHAIHIVTNKLRSQNSDLTFRHFRYKDPFWAEFFRQALNETLFTGVTGNVSFEGNERRGSILLKQLQAGREVQIAEYHSTKDTLSFRTTEQIYWRGNRSAASCPHPLSLSFADPISVCNLLCSRHDCRCSAALPGLPTPCHPTHATHTGNAPPVDRTFRQILPSRVSLTLFVVISIFAVCGIILACVFLAMNIKYRNQK